MRHFICMSVNPSTLNILIMHVPRTEHASISRVLPDVFSTSSIVKDLVLERNSP